MSEVGTTARSLVFESGKDSSAMTHELKVFGEGNMQNGFKRLAIFFFEEGRRSGYKTGERNGAIKGVAGTLFVGSLVAGGCYIVERYRINKAIKEHEKEGMKIQDVMKQAVPEDAEVENKRLCGIMNEG